MSSRTGYWKDNSLHLGLSAKRPGQDQTSAGPSTEHPLDPRNEEISKMLANNSTQTRATSPHHPSPPRKLSVIFPEHRETNLGSERGKRSM